MSFNEVLAELPALTVAERQLLVRRALDLDESPLSPEDEALIEQRLLAHQQNPSSTVSLDDMKYHLYVRQKIETGLSDIATGRSHSHDSVRNEFGHDS